MVELLAINTGVAPFTILGDSIATEHSILLGYTVVVVEPLASRFTAVSVQTAAEVKPAFVVAIE